MRPLMMSWMPKMEILVAVAVAVAVAAADSASSVLRLDQTPIDGDKMEWKGPGRRKMPVLVFYYIIYIYKEER